MTHSIPDLVAQMRERVDAMQAHAGSPEMVAALSDVLATFEAVVPLLLRQSELVEQHGALIRERDFLREENAGKDSEVRVLVEQYAIAVDERDKAQEARRYLRGERDKLKEQLEAAQERIARFERILAQPSDKWHDLLIAPYPARDPLGYIELDEHGMCPHDYVKGLGCHVCDPASSLGRMATHYPGEPDPASEPEAS